MEHAGLFGALALQPICALVDLAHRRDAHALLEVRERAVIGRHHRVAIGGARHTGASLGAHPRVHHRDEHRSLRPEAHGLVQPVRGAPDIIAGDLMRAVDDLQLAVNALDHPVHGAHRALLVGEIGLEDQNGFHGGFLLDERIVEAAVVDESRYAQRAGEDQQRHHDRREVLPVQAPEGVPGALVALAEAAQVHGIADQLNAIERREDERDDDQQRVFEAVSELGFARKVQPARLLRQADVVVVALDVGEVAQGERHGISSLIRHPYPVQRRCEFAGVGGEQKDHAQRDDRGVFEELGDLVKQLLLREVNLADHARDLMARAVNLHPELRGKEEGDDRIGDDEHQHIDHHGADLRELHTRYFEDNERKKHHQQHHAQVIGVHHGESEQQETHQLGQPRKAVHKGIHRVVREQFHLGVHRFFSSLS